METEQIRLLLESVRAGDTPIDSAMERLRDLPFEDLGFATLDHHRAIRNGFPEVIYCEGKAIEHTVEIARKLKLRSYKVLATRASAEVAQAIQRTIPESVYHALARMLVIPGDAVYPVQPPALRGTVLVVTAGTSDIPVAEEAAITAGEMGSAVERIYDVGVAGIHRLLDKRQALYSASVLIVVAGMEGALASVVGGLVDKPVIAVPTSIGYGASFQGLAALLSMLNTCATGVAVMNIDNGFGAGYFAHLVNSG